MSKQKISLLTLSVAVLAAVAESRFVQAGIQATAAGRAQGVSTFAATAAGQMIGVDVIGTTIVETGGAIANDALIEVGANGVAVTRTAGVGVARALQAATASGQFIEVLLIPN